jgi:hypothetical protein
MYWGASMKVIWKRPDGYHGASPSDYTVVEISPNSRIWLHKKDQRNYPFRVSGGWQDEDSTRKLNSFVNLIDKSTKEWVACLANLFDHAKTESPEGFLEQEQAWLDELKSNLKGDTWELEIMTETLNGVKQRIALVKADFLKGVQT